MTDIPPRKFDFDTVFDGGGGVAYAVQNRLKKAAAFHIVDAEVEA